MSGNFDLGSWFGKEHVCREERQYALFLYNKLLQNNNDFNKEILEDGANVIDAYYEATFMRDLFHMHREINKTAKSTYVDFNELLLAFEIPAPYVNSTEIVLLDEDKKRNLGHISLSNNQYDNNEKLLILKYMMNAKPDIAVLYEKEGAYKLTFLECKYESGVDKYNLYDDKKISQLEVQDLILSFLCGDKYGLLYDGTPVERGEVKVVRFDKKGEGINIDEASKFMTIKVPLISIIP